VSGFCTVEEAISDIALGRMVVVVDSPDRENEGDLIMAADAVTPEAINFMATEARGLICVSVARERLEQLGIGPMVAPNTDPKRTAFHVSVDLAVGTTTGISARDRATTIAGLVDPDARPGDFNRPGHVFPLAAQPGGVLARAGHTEAASDLSRLAGRAPSGVLCEIADVDGEMARLPRLREFAAGHALPILAVGDLIAYRRHTEGAVVRAGQARVPLSAGEFTAVGYRELDSGREHVAFVIGDLGGDSAPLVRVHSECLTGDVFGSQRCDCGKQLEQALRMIAREGRGAVVYLRGHEGRGIGLLAKLDAYSLQDGQGLDTVEANLALGLPADLRDYGVGAHILRDLGASSVRLLTNNPAKCAGLEGYGMPVVERVALVTTPTRDNLAYLDAKRRRMGHMFDGVPIDVTVGASG
jgi:3,4-dihydroxy 2-butanone 4-phosphate synthase/GTP cyclohydrolase II